MSEQSDPLEPSDSIPLGSTADVCQEIRLRADAIRKARPKTQRTADEQQILWGVNVLLARLEFLRAGGEDAGSTTGTTEGDADGLERLRRSLDVATRLMGDPALLREVETHLSEYRRLRDLDDILPAPKKEEDG